MEASAEEIQELGVLIRDLVATMWRFMSTIKNEGGSIEIHSRMFHRLVPCRFADYIYIYIYALLLQQTCSTQRVVACPGHLWEPSQA